MRVRSLVVVAACVSPLVILGCAQILGVDTDSILREAGAPQAEASTDAASASEGAVMTTDAGCALGTKNCAGTCVAADEPGYGCADATTCSPCSLPYAEPACGIAAVNAGSCTVGTCHPGFDDCDKKAANGCESDLLSGPTCGSCDHACPDASPLCGVPSTAASPTCLSSCVGVGLQCGTACVDDKASPTNCGGCGVACGAGTNADPSCVDAGCVDGGACRAGFGDCDGNPRNGCEPLKVFFVDADGDGFGVTSMPVAACSAPKGTAAIGGDCLDSDPRVHPGQTTYFASPYADPQSGIKSFDYDCDGTEVVAPGTPLFTVCSEKCAESGYARLQVDRGKNTNAYCSSQDVETCAMDTMMPMGSICATVSTKGAPVTCK